MPARKFLNILALAAVAIVALSSLPTHVNALVADHPQVARHVHGHDAIARRKRSDSSSAGAPGRCKPRPTSMTSTSTSPTYTPPPATSSTPPAYTPPPATSSTSPASSPSSSAPASPTPSSTSSQQKKWGLAWGTDDSYLPHFALSGVGYLYTWRADIPAGLSNYGIQGVPMLWGADSDRINAFKATVTPGYAHHVAGFNEPNEPSQSNLSPSDAYNLWMELINPLKNDGYALISPACTNDDAGKQWYREFFGSCDSNPDCQVDIVAFHGYTTNASAIIDYANYLHNTYNRDVWITEFADQDFSGNNQQADMNQIWDFAGQMVGFVDNTPWVTAFPFGVVDPSTVNTNPLNALLNTGSDYPTDLGYYYLNQN